MYGEADYCEGTTAYMWLTNKIDEFAQRTRRKEKEKLEQCISSTPRHLV